MSSTRKAACGSGQQLGKLLAQRGSGSPAPGRSSVGAALTRAPRLVEYEPKQADMEVHSTVEGASLMPVSAVRGMEPSAMPSSRVWISVAVAADGRA